MREEKKNYRPDPTDVFVFMGIGLIGAGTWLISRPASLIVVGSLLLLLALAPYLANLFKSGK